MPRLSKFAIAGLAIVIPLLIWSVKEHTSARVESKIETVVVLLAAPGRVQGREETISLGAAADGIVKAVLVRDGQGVRQKALLAVISCDDIRAEIDRDKAEEESARQARLRILRGHREEERKAALQKAGAAKAVLVQAQGHLQRIDGLYHKAEISRDSFEQATRDFEVARANYESSLEDENLVNAQPLPEEKSQADAQVLAAEQNANVASEKLEKCNVRAPISGTILKVMARVGESYSILVPHPLFTLADDSVRRVKAEVDERDIGKVKLGQTAIISADGFPGRKFDGRVIQLGHAMGQKSVLSDDPAEKVDREVLEVIIELNRSAEELPIGLRVTAQFF